MSKGLLILWFIFIIVTLLTAWGILAFLHAFGSPHSETETNETEIQNVSSVANTTSTPNISNVCSSNKPKLSRTELSRLLANQCYVATIRSINNEMARFKEWIQTYDPSSNNAVTKPKLYRQLSILSSTLTQYKKIDPNNYTCEYSDATTNTSKINLIGWVGDNCSFNDLIYFDRLTRSGPFYHIAGVFDPECNGTSLNVSNSDVCSGLKPNVKYNMTFSLIYPEYYPFESYYVFIQSYTPLNEEQVGTPINQSICVNTI